MITIYRMVGATSLDVSLTTIRNTKMGFFVD